MSCCVGMCCRESSWLGVHRMLHSMSCCVGMCCRESSWLGVRRMLHSMSCCVGMCCRESSWLGVHRMLHSMSCCVGMCCRESSCLGVRPLLCSIRHTPSQLLSLQHIPTQHDTLPQNLVCKNELNCEYCYTTLARNNKAPWWWSDKIETCRSDFKCF